MCFAARPFVDRPVGVEGICRHGAVADGQKLSPAAQRREQRGVGAGEPGLAREPGERLEERGAPPGIEMRGDLVEQQQRRLAAQGPLQLGMRQQDRDQQRLLLAGRGGGGGTPVLRQW